MKAPLDPKGPRFEKAVHAILNLLVKAHPDEVSVTAQPRLKLLNGELVIPDFDLSYVLPDAQHSHVIECQDRAKSSQEVARKLRHIKSLSSRNRAVFVYRKSDFLSEELRASLEADGIRHLDLVGFADFARRISSVLSAVRQRPDDRARLASLAAPLEEFGKDRDKDEERTAGPADRDFLDELAALALQDPDLGSGFLHDLYHASAKSPDRDQAMSSPIDLTPPPRPPIW